VERLGCNFHSEAQSSFFGDEGTGARVLCDWQPASALQCTMCDRSLLNEKCDRRCFSLTCSSVATIILPKKRHKSPPLSEIEMSFLAKSPRPTPSPKVDFFIVKFGYRFHCPDSSLRPASVLRLPIHKRTS
jgi:hypothetical protein